MLTTVTQRWLFGEESFRDAGEPVRAVDWELVDLNGDTEPRAFIEAHHYAGSYTAARVRHALVHVPTLQTAGIAIYDVPAQERCLDILPGELDGKLHFGRLTMLPWVPGCGESMFIGESLRRLKRDGYTGVVSFADPEPRARVDGTIVHPGHVGIIYQATNGRLVGRSKPDTLWLMPDGTALHRRASSKVSRLAQGWRYVVERLVKAGAVRPNFGDTRSEAACTQATAWVTYWRGRLCRKVRHPGNWKYAWGLDKAARRHLERTTQALPYPEPMGGRVPPKWGRRAALLGFNSAVSRREHP